LTEKVYLKLQHSHDSSSQIQIAAASEVLLLSTEELAGLFADDENEVAS